MQFRREVFYYTFQRSEMHFKYCKHVKMKDINIEKVSAGAFQEWHIFVMCITYYTILKGNSQVQQHERP